MNAFRTTLNVLGLERRDMPSANPAVVVALPPRPVATGYDLATLRKFANEAAGENEVQRITLGGAQAEPTYLTIKLRDSLVTNLIAGNRPSSDGVRDLLIFNGNGAAARQTSGAGKLVVQDVHFATGGDDVVYVGTANGGVWKTTNGGGAAVKSGFGYAALTVGGATHASTGDADLGTRMGQRPTS